MASQWNHRFVGTLAVATALLGSAAFAQTSELYLNDWQTPTTWVVQNGAIVRQFSRSGTTDGPGLVVQSTIKCIGQNGGSTGREYDLIGTPLSGGYPNQGYASLYDGATSGSRNWSIGHNDFTTNFAVLEGNADWQGLQPLFEPARRSSGIAYDARTGTLWVANTVGSADRVQQYDLSGSLLSEFSVNLPGAGYALAWDPADDTLWLPGAFGTKGHLYQYSKSGVLLQDVPINGLGDILGAEFGAASNPVYTLSVTGSCPGTVSVAWSNATPQRQQGIVYGANQGGTTIPGGPCAGTVLGVQGNVRLVNTIGTGSGSGSVNGQAGSGACGDYLQLVESGSCNTSNVAQIP